MALATLQHTHARLNVAGFQESKQCSIYHKRNWHNKCTTREIGIINVEEECGLKKHLEYASAQVSTN